MHKKYYPAVARICTLCILSFLMFLSPAPLSGTTSRISIGVLATRGPEQCLKQWSPTADYLTARIPDHAFTIVLLDFEEINKAVANEGLAQRISAITLHSIQSRTRQERPERHP